MARAAEPSATRASAALSSSRPIPVLALTATTSAPGTSSRASSIAMSSVSSSTRSAFVIATTPVWTPRSRRIARCSSVCGRAPSAASITSRNRSIPVAPATIVRTKRSWPGTSISESRRPSGSTSGAYPRSIEIPRRCSSGSRSVLPGQCPHEPCLSVVDVPGGADRQRHADAVAARAAATAAAASSISPSVSARTSRSRRPSRTIPTTGGSPTAGGRTASPRSRTQSWAAPRAAALHHRPGPPSPRPRRRAGRASRSARARTVATGSASIRSTGTSARARSGSSARASVPSSAASVSLSARSAR